MMTDVEEAHKVANAIWWVRRDLRLADNRALAAALAHGKAILPVFVLDPALLRSPCAGDKRLAFLFDGLRALDEDLRNKGGRLIVRTGEPAEVLSALTAEVGARTICAEADVSPYARRRDARVGEALPLMLTEGLTVHPPDGVLKEDGDPYIVYTPYSRTWKSLPLPDTDDLFPAPTAVVVPKGIASEEIPGSPVLPDAVPFRAGEAAAQERLRAFTDAMIYDYRQERDRMDLASTSRLSPYLRFGMISLRSAVVAALRAKEAAPSDAARQGATTWLDELIWREFYLSILLHFPQVRHRSFRPEYRELVWQDDPQGFAAWQSGRTGYPVVDAAMRQLDAIGWMHNRARMIVASFLTKDLLIDWRRGERHFMQHLIDGDPAANNGGWQWSAGTGTDAAPYFRIFNPVLQSKKYDPDGDYIRRWVPELRDVPARYIHEPWKMPAAVQHETACVIGDVYPAPIVDHKEARDRALAAYKAARESYA